MRELRTTSLNKRYRFTSAKLRKSLIMQRKTAKKMQYHLVRYDGQKSV